MLIPIDKEKILGEFKAKYVDGWFSKEVSKIYERLNENRESIEGNLLCKFNEVCSLAEGFQKEDLKGEIKYIYICYLRTSIMDNRAVFRIDLHDEKCFLDKNECSINIDFDFIYEGLFKHMEELKEKRREYGRVITEMDIEKIKIEEMKKYNDILIKFLENMISNLLDCKEYKEMKKHEEIMIFAGEYRDEVRLLYEKHENLKEDSVNSEENQIL